MMSLFSAQMYNCEEIGADWRNQGIVALSCAGVGKTFPVVDEGTVWRVLLGSADCRKGTDAVEAVSLMVPKGQVLGILGPNGAGKSTLLRVLAGIFCHTTGSIHVDGSVSGVFEMGGFGRPDLTGSEYARRVLRMSGTDRSALPDALEEIRAFSELGSYFDAPLYTLSSGMAARLYFSTVTALRYDVYLIDEALAVGDEHFKQKCWRRFRRRLSEGASGVLVTHDWPNVLRLCETSCVMDRGRIIESGPTEQVVASYLSRAATVRSDIVQFSGDNAAEFEAQSGRDAEFRFAVDVIEAVPVKLFYSIEVVRPGSLWEVVLLEEDIPIGTWPGRYNVCLRIPALPLVAGRYYLNLFLTTTGTQKSDGERVPCDARSWTHGNPIPLTVRGGEPGGVVALRLEWTKIVRPERHLAEVKPAASPGEG